MEVVLLAKQNRVPLAKSDEGVPSEMSPIKEITNPDLNTPIVEVNQPIESKDPLEIKNPSAVTVI